jgi:integrase
MALTDKAVSGAKAAEKPYKVSDERGLYLLISPNGSKWWRLKYRIDGKEKLLSLGVYPDVSLKKAREDRDKFRQTLANGIDPSVQRQAEKVARADAVANSFEAIALEWMQKQAKTLTPQYIERMRNRFKRDIFPALAKRPITDIKAADLLRVLRKMEARGINESAHRALGECGRIFRYAVATQRIELDITGSLRGALAPRETEHFAAITEAKAVGALLRAIWDYSGSPVVSAALQLAPLVFVRPGELRRAEWSHISFESTEWRYHVTKTKTDHVVPLSSQAIEVLQRIHALTGHGQYVFPSMRAGGRPMSDNAILAALRRMGIGRDEMTGHGFRAMARTILDEELGFRVDLIEHQLAHAVRDANGRAYNRTSHLPERKRMMQAWADYLDRLRVGTDVKSVVGNVLVLERAA